MCLQIIKITLCYLKDHYFFQATDLDETSVLKYELDGNFEAVGSNINHINEPFKINGNDGSILLNFEVKSNMNGYFKFSVTATDGRNYKLIYN